MQPYKNCKINVLIIADEIKNANAHPSDPVNKIDQAVLAALYLQKVGAQTTLCYDDTYNHLSEDLNRLLQVEGVIIYSLDDLMQTLLHYLGYRVSHTSIKKQKGNKKVGSRESVPPEKGLESYNSVIVFTRNGSNTKHLNLVNCINPSKSLIIWDTCHIGIDCTIKSHIAIVTTDDIGLGSVSIIEIAAQAELWRIRLGTQAVCLRLGEMGIIFKDTLPLPVWIPIHPLFPSKYLSTVNTYLCSVLATIQASDQYSRLYKGIRTAFELSRNKDIPNLRFHQYKQIDGKMELLSRPPSSESTIILPGTFDRIHQGHINLIRAGRYLGSRLIVILDSDKRIRKRKGQDRPFRSLVTRIKDLQATRLVDEVRVLNHQKEFKSLLSFYPNSVVVKGAEYRRGFREFLEKDSDIWQALCVESHSDLRSSKLI